MLVQVFRTRITMAVAMLALAALAGCTSGSDVGPAENAGSDAKTDAAAQTLPARWWTWAAAAPKASDPISDTTGEWCGKNQPTDVWFLAGTFGNGPISRSCEIPTGTPVYFPVLNQFCEAGSGQSAAEAIADCQITPDLAEVGTFQLLPNKDSALAGHDPSVVAVGSWVGPLTLDPGRHTLSIHGKSGDFEVEVTYKLTVA
jgi:hypothetical protein